MANATTPRARRADALAVAAGGRPGFGRALAISLAGHVVVGLALLVSPAPKPYRIPPVITVRLVAPQAAAPGKQAPMATAAAQPAPKPAPSQPAPVRAPKKVLLPKQPAAVRKKPKAAKKRPKPKPMEYDDALAALRDEMGEETPQATEEVDVTPGGQEGETGAGASEGFLVSAELAAWMSETKRHLRKVWITPPEFLNQGLVTELRVLLNADGTVLGTPEIVRSSGNPYWDDNTIRALMRGSPLPPPPEPGEWPFIFTPEGRD